MYDNDEKRQFNRTPSSFVARSSAVDTVQSGGNEKLFGLVLVVSIQL